MIIEYTDTALRTEIIGKNWKAYLYDRKRNTNIVYELWDVINDHLDVDFEFLKQIIWATYKNKKSKSDVNIIGCYGNLDKEITITNKGVFPNILILKDENRKR